MTARSTDPTSAGAASMRERLRVVIQASPARYAQLFSPETDRKLHAMAEVVTLSAPPTADNLQNALAEADAFWLPRGFHVPRAILEAAPRLHWIGDTSGGPPLLDYPYVLARNIAVTDCRRAFGPAVGELAIALYLAVMRDVVVHDRALHTADRPEGKDKAENHEASHRIIGMIGLGGIARSLLRFLAPFEPRLLVHDPFLPDDAIRAAGAEPVALPALLGRADAIFVMAVPTSENRGLIGPAELDLIRPDAVLLIISRAWLVDEAALIERLRAGRFRAAMDVFETEPLPANHPYRSLPNVVLTPHRAGGTAESYRRIGDDLVADLECLATGQPPTHNAPVTLEIARLQRRLASS